MTDKYALNAVVVDRIDYHPSLMRLRVAYKEGVIPDFKPGQFGTLGLPDPDSDNPRPIRRAYSIASANHQKDFVEYFITLVEDGALTPKLFNLKIGDSVWMAPKITGFFTLEGVDPNQNLVLIGTGTGLAPYISMVESLGLGKEGQKTTVVHGVRHCKDLGYVEELNSLSNERDGLFYLPVVSRPEEKDKWNGLCGRVQVCWEKVKSKVDWGTEPTPENTHIYLCGNPQMVIDMTKLLEEEGYRAHSRKEPGQIHVEKYW